MNFYEMLCFAKIYSIVFGLSSANAASKQEIEVACEVLKKMADNRSDWNEDQKQTFKYIAEYLKQQTEGNEYGNTMD